MLKNVVARILSCLCECTALGLFSGPCTLTVRQCLECSGHGVWILTLQSWFSLSVGILTSMLCGLLSVLCLVFYLGTWRKCVFVCHVLFCQPCLVCKREHMASVMFVLPCAFYTWIFVCFYVPCAFLTVSSLGPTLLLPDYWFICITFVTLLFFFPNYSPFVLYPVPNCHLCSTCGSLFVMPCSSPAALDCVFPPLRRFKLCFVYLFI